MLSFTCGATATEKKGSTRAAAERRRIMEKLLTHTQGIVVRCSKKLQIILYSPVVYNMARCQDRTEESRKEVELAGLLNRMVVVPRG